MTDQSPRGNGFRAQISTLGEARPSPIVAEKKARRDEAADGLVKVGVPRSESRRGDHRGRDRHRLNDECTTVVRKGREHQVALVNLSAGGAMVEGSLKARLWDMVDLQLGPLGSIECAVRWIRGDRFGLEFAHETRIDCDPATRDEMLREVIRRSFPEVESLDSERSSEEPPKQERAQPRHPLIWHAIVRHDYEWDKARLRNISSGGVLIECLLNLNPGDSVQLDLDDAGRFAATVSWARGGQSGLAFAEPFDIRLLARSRPTVATDQWVAPDYLKDSSDSSPWAARWERLTVQELRRSLDR